MPRLIFRRLALALFLVYLALVPGATTVVALDQVPAWGAWLGAALLLLQGACIICWLIGSQGRRGALAGASVFLLGWGVERLGVAIGFPFGRYSYTDALQPQLPGGVPLAIPCAWLMVAVGASQVGLWIVDCGLGSAISVKDLKSTIKYSLVAATLVVLLDLQIETVATAINRYWIWRDGGLYYGVPATNFIAWWLVGLAMAALLAWAGPAKHKEQRTKSQATYTSTQYRATTQHARHNLHHILQITPHIPTYLYLLNTLMFAAINLARGYTLAGLIGLGVLLVAAGILAPAAARARQTLI